MDKTFILKAHSWTMESMFCSAHGLALSSMSFSTFAHHMEDPMRIFSCNKYVAFLDNSGSDSRNLIGQLQVSKRGRNLERDSKCQWGGF